MKTNDGKAYCSKRCLEATAPICAWCRRRCTKGYYKKKGYAYCSKKCFRSTLPLCSLCHKRFKEGAKIDDATYCNSCITKGICSACGHPFAMAKKLSDNRLVCVSCFRRGIFDERKTSVCFNRALLQMSIVTGKRPEIPPSFELIDLTTMNKIGDEEGQNIDNKLVRRGLYKRTVTTTTTRAMFGAIKKEDRKIDEKIYLLIGQNEQEMTVTAVHELTHDLIADLYPKLEKAPIWVHEGIAQYVAASVCLRNGYYDILKDIETCPDSCYGDGYRYFKKIAGDNNWHKINRWIKTVTLATLPNSAPAD